MEDGGIEVDRAAILNAKIRAWDGRGGRGGCIHRLSRSLTGEEGGGSLRERGAGGRLCGGRDRRQRVQAAEWIHEDLGDVDARGDGGQQEDQATKVPECIERAETAAGPFFSEIKFVHHSLHLKQ